MSGIGAVVSSQETAALMLRGVSKRFGAQVALRDVDLDLAGGEVHALLGQNGSGKSTLIKILAGVHEPESGATATAFGAPVDLGSGADAHRAGMRFVHQDLALVPDRDVVDNLALGSRYAGRLWLRDGHERAVAQALLDGLGIDVDAGRLVRDLSPAERTMVAVARALRDGSSAARVLVLDEVSAALPEEEVEIVFALVRRIREQGGTVLFVTHRLEEVFALADRVTVLRDGARVATVPVAGLEHQDLVELIVGQALGELYPGTSPPASGAQVALRVRGLTGPAVRGVDLDLRRGEIVGLAGLTGSGRSEVPYLLFGAVRWTAGDVRLGARTLTQLEPTAAIAAGLALVPADRAARGATPTMTLRENVTLPRLSRNRFGWIPGRGEWRDAHTWLQRLEVVPDDPEAPLATLSGGNQQKAVLARWMRCSPSVLMLDEPTQGVDVGSKAAIYAQLAQHTQRGMSVLMASTDHEELASVCDRVLVLRDGRIGAELHGAALTPEAISEQVLARETPVPPDRKES